MRSKYNAKKVTLDGHQFDSAREAEHYRALKTQEQEGLISELVLQPRFVLVPPFECQGERVRKMEYVADFQYRDPKRGIVVEDVKGFKTPEYKLKAKLFKYLYVREGKMIFEEV